MNLNNEKLVKIENYKDPINNEHIDKIDKFQVSIQSPYNMQQKWSETDFNNLKNFLRKYYPEE